MTLGVQKGQIATGVQTVAPLTAVELLIELHSMKGTSVKPSIEAVSLCLNEKSVFTFEGSKFKAKANTEKLIFL